MEFSNKHKKRYKNIRLIVVRISLTRDTEIFDIVGRTKPLPFKVTDRFTKRKEFEKCTARMEGIKG
ncbi:MAG: hypothetical protein JWP81_462 [Ferruginibacter sp.]|nr:hypothetical protein [Ferruginibacter sp.]